MHRRMGNKILCALFWNELSKWVCQKTHCHGSRSNLLFYQTRNSFSFELQFSWMHHTINQSINRLVIFFRSITRWAKGGQHDSTTLNAVFSMHRLLFIEIDRFQIDLKRNKQWTRLTRQASISTFGVNVLPLFLFSKLKMSGFQLTKWLIEY